MTFESKDPSATPAFVQPTGPPPYEPRDLLLKQCDLRDLDPAGQLAFTLFSSFAQSWEQNRDRNIHHAQEMLTSLSPTGTEYEVRSDTRHERRFSGDGRLSRARYFSVCRDDGLDGGTMLRELTAYLNPMSDGPVEIQDLTEGKHAPGEQQLGTSASQPGGRTGVLVSIPPYSATQHDWLHDAVQRWETTTIFLPVRTTQEHFEGLVDLRYPVAAEWFTRELTELRWIAGDGSEAPAFPNKEPLDNFVDLLPSLMVQYHGGGQGATRIAGQWLRSLGADGLVFPSARSDSWVDADHEGIKDFYGWTLVDYRDSPPVRLQSFDLTPAWITQVSNEIDEMPLPHQTGVFLEREALDRTRGSWAWHNLEESNLAARLLASALYLYEWARGGVTDEQRRELGRMLGGTNAQGPGDLVQTSAWFVRAILGDERIRLNMIEAAGETLASEQAQLIDLTGTFHHMDTRLAAGRARRLG